MSIQVTETLAPKKRGKQPTYRLARNIVIPAGTPVQIAPVEVRRHGEWASVLKAEGPDSTSEWVIPLDEALELGLIEKVE